ncbi:hypothetical protein MD535_21945 [Vibrio sp. ZSDZ65]|uniref:Uncharacterized protein n=1 Tax=Vibrio qingdaonensis TaxID=2829491 RepID=A0A9X3CSJ5_9VIBR|nr:hypothetical protein [Vibrio qingdaonensis]MCW8348655.1 hypothetical protein [Vibrio qingdaonensis]
MLNSKGGYILGMEVVTPTGMNLDIATEVARSDLGRFGHQVAEDGLERFSYAKVEFTKHQNVEEKLQEMLGYVVESLVRQLPRVLNPIPLLIALPKGIEAVHVREWIIGSALNEYISHVETIQVEGPRVVTHALKAMEKYDALMCVSADSLVSQMASLTEKKAVMSNLNPWGLIPSEGAAGIVLCRKNLIDTLKLTPKAQLGYVEVDDNPADRRGIYRLVQKASRVMDCFGEVYSDMTNLRAHTEDYGFALGSRAEYFTNPNQPKLINELWGTMGCCSSLALIAFTIREHHFKQPASLLIFGENKAKAFVQLISG